jgi:hypothetical protein
VCERETQDEVSIFDEYQVSSAKFPASLSADMLNVRNGWKADICLLHAAGSRKLADTRTVGSTMMTDKGDSC